ncbi:hypothetical protein GGH15_002612 [Coemansia sp. RSA 562]|nr:hypothetical protein GGH15_002612 [Coemansia sp. RSA 562]
MSRHRIANTVGLVLATLVCWLYGLHLYHAANRPLYSDVKLPSIEPVSPHSTEHTMDPVLSDSNDGILTFVHASDLHISKYVATGGLVHFQHFLRTAVPLVSPRLVVVTGDLTDGKDKQKLISQQQLEEWQAYKRALSQTDYVQRFNGTFYRDQRGNHDCFNVFSQASSENYFGMYSAVGDSSGYMLRIDEPFGTYSFVASDGCPRHGFARPLNFFGYLDARDMQLLESRLEEARGSSHVFMLNHYPVSTMVYGKYRKEFGELVRQVSVFLCGHLHELVGGIGAQLQAYKAREGYWELEIGDMKEHAVYRVYAVDHDIVSFVDVRLPLPQIPMPNPELLDVRVEAPVPHPPVVLVTNPKDARYLLPKHEPLERIRESTFIRMLVWTDQPVASVQVQIDGQVHPHPAVFRGTERQVGSSANETVKTPLWVAPWDPELYNDGTVHELQVVATDAAGKTTTSRTPFVIGQTLVPLQNDARGGWIMQQSFSSMFQTSACVSYILMTLCLLVVPRVYFATLPNFSSWLSERSVLHHKDMAYIRHLYTLCCNADSAVAKVKLGLAMLAARAKFLVWTQFTAQVYLASVPWLFWPGYFFAMGMCILPLFTGRLIPSAQGSDAVGSVYAYGIYISHEWSPLLDSWTYALASIVSLAVLLVYLPVAVASPSMFYAPRAKRPWYRTVTVRVLVVLFVLVYLGAPTLMTAYTYGWVSIVFGYGRGWLFVVSCLALYVVDWRMPVSLSNTTAA